MYELPVKIVLKNGRMWNYLLSWSSYDKLFKIVQFGPICDPPPS